MSDGWHRVVEFRWDASGQVIAVAHLQRQKRGDPLGHRGSDGKSLHILLKILRKKPSPHVTEEGRAWKLRHSFAAGMKFEEWMGRRRIRLTCPAAPYKRSGRGVCP